MAIQSRSPRTLWTDCSIAADADRLDENGARPVFTRENRREFSLEPDDAGDYQQFKAVFQVSREFSHERSGHRPNRSGTEGALAAVETYTAGILVLLLGAAVGGYFYVTRAAAKRLEAAIAEADRLDPGWRLAEIEAKRPVIPDHENSARKIISINHCATRTWNYFSAIPLPHGYRVVNLWQCASPRRRPSSDVTCGEQRRARCHVARRASRCAAEQQEGGSPRSTAVHCFGLPPWDVATSYPPTARFAAPASLRPGVNVTAKASPQLLVARAGWADAFARKSYRPGNSGQTPSHE
jgi:hypothetical protein